MRDRARTLGRILVAVAWLGGGCASYTQKALQVREPLGRGDWAAAEAFLEEHAPGGRGLPFLMELGLVHRYEGDYRQSNVTFERAERLVDELYTRSISKAALSLLTSDEIEPYDGEMWERVLVNYYRALNYIDLGEFEDALVECRKINHKLKVYVDSSDDPPAYSTDAFAQYLTALLYDAGGETNDTWVSLRLAEQAYRAYDEAYGTRAPPALASDLLRLADAQGFREEAEELRERYPDAQFVPTAELLQQGEIILFYEEGFAPAKIQNEITIPILKTEWEDGYVELSHTLAHRARGPFAYKKTELEYLLRIALPSFPPPTPADVPGYAVMKVGEATVRTAVAEDLHAIARRGLDDRMGGILVKTIFRALTKYAVTRGIEKKDEVAGTIFNLLAAATEKADTRAWITLPGTIQIARLVVPPGEHEVRLDCYRPDGRTIDSVRFEAVSVRAGEVRFLSHRTF